jgi:hypothetical protein
MVEVFVLSYERSDVKDEESSKERFILLVYGMLFRFNKTKMNIDALVTQRAVKFVGEDAFFYERFYSVTNKAKRNVLPNFFHYERNLRIKGFYIACFRLDFDANFVF